MQENLNQVCDLSDREVKLQTLWTNFRREHRKSHTKDYGPHRSKELGL